MVFGHSGPPFSLRGQPWDQKNASRGPTKAFGRLSKALGRLPNALGRLPKASRALPERLWTLQECSWRAPRRSWDALKELQKALGAHPDRFQSPRKAFPTRFSITSRNHDFSCVFSMVFQHSGPPFSLRGLLRRPSGSSRRTNLAKFGPSEALRRLSEACGGTVLRK